MTPFKSGIVFLVDIVLMIAIQLFLALNPDAGGLSLAGGVLLSESICIVPACFFAIIFSAKAREAFRFNYVKPSTFAFTALMVLLLNPLLSALNAFTMLFTDNVAALEGAKIVNEGLPKMVFVLAVIAPLAEELLFRGVILSGLRNGKPILSAIILQAVMFGFMHMNLNQMLYAIALGVFNGFLIEVTDSIWPCVFAHAMVNLFSVIGLFALPEDEISDLVSRGGDREELILTFAVTSCVSVLTTALAGCTVVRIAKNEPGGMDRLRQIFRKNEGKRVMSIPAFAGLAISLTMVAMNL